MPSIPKIVVVGAGVGGLTTAALLAKRGYEVEVFERNNRVGGRCAAMDVGPYRFDTGPTFLMMKYILDDVFGELGLKSSDFMDFVHLDPMYRLYYPDGKTLDVTDDHDRMQENIARLFPSDAAGLKKLLKSEAKRFDVLSPCFIQDYSKFSHLFGRNLRRALPYIPVGQSVAGVLKRYFKSEDTQLAFMFQTKYLGMSPWKCPGAFTIIPYIEHAFGIYHITGGLAKIPEALAKAATQFGAKIHLNTPIRRIEVVDGAAKAVYLDDDWRVVADSIVINADFGQAMSQLMPSDALRKYTPKKLKKMRYSCSTFMLYLGLDCRYEHLAHHNIVFSNDYRQNIDEIFNGRISVEPSFYVRDSSAIDSTVAPAGHSALYVLVPVPNQQTPIDWSAAKNDFRETVLNAVEQRLKLPGLRSHIKEERIITPHNWEHQHRVHYGATFNLAHNLGQMLWFRPHNEFEEARNIYLVGGGTHPGSGLPTIIESGWISAGLIAKRFG
ncbi:MAG: phytoene desaturase family protein [Patescibacteria group bacterium]